MLHTEYVCLEAYWKYLEFLQENSVDENTKGHWHHIIPKFMGGSDDDSNLVKLSKENHQKAHILFSDCFDEKSKERIKNLQSARFIKKNAELPAGLFSGAANPFYGKEHTLLNLLRLRLKAKEIADFRKGKTYTEIYSNPELERTKRSTGVKRYWETLPESARKLRLQKLPKADGRVPVNKYNGPNRIFVDELEFGSWRQAIEYFGKSEYKIRKQHKVEVLSR